MTWISVKEKLPPNDKIVYVKRIDNYIVKGYYDKKTDIWRHPSGIHMSDRTSHEEWCEECYYEKWKQAKAILEMENKIKSALDLIEQQMQALRKELFGA